jgi:hypothetical protein
MASPEGCGCETYLPKPMWDTGGETSHSRAMKTSGPCVQATIHAHGWTPRKPNPCASSALPFRRQGRCFHSDERMLTRITEATETLRNAGGLKDLLKDRANGT